ncbi:MAG: NAD(P)/FAD-dependent oxidoreductase [Chloroflexi bacterium]|nr:NAD(P)/FAD-dependent oxidoreductase [Chloroflexota bacterium]
MYDVAIIGAGVVGSYIASELAKLGHSVCVLEKHPEPGYKTSCTGIISSECLGLLNVDRDIIQQESRSAKIFSPSGNYIKVEQNVTQAYVLDRPALDRTLASRAVSAGVKYFFLTPVTNIIIDKTKVQILASKHTKTVSLDARAVVVATGFMPALTKQLGLGSCPDFAYGAQAEVSCDGTDEVEIYSGKQLAPGFFAWLVPIGNKRAKTGLLCMNNPKYYLDNLLKTLEKQGKIRVAGCKFSFGKIPLKPLPRTYGGRLIVVGDAAGQVKPTTGGGIYFGVLSAQVASQVLHDALVHDDLSVRNLSRYQKGWHNILRHELDIDYWAHKFYSKLNDQQIDHIFNIIERHGVHESILTSPDITFDWHSKVILDVIKHRSLQKSLEKLNLGFLTVKKNK